MAEADETMLVDEVYMKSEIEDEIKSEPEDDIGNEENYTSNVRETRKIIDSSTVEQVERVDPFNHFPAENFDRETFSIDVQDENLSREPLKDPLDSKQNQPSNKSSILSKSVGTKRKYKKRNAVPKILSSQRKGNSLPRGLKYYKMIILEENEGRCDICCAVFKNYILLRDHQKEVHQVDPIVFCEACAIPCSSKEVYAIHRRNSHKDYKFSQDQGKKETTHRCKVCKLKIKNPRLFHYHMASEHPDDLEKVVDAKYKKHPSNIQNKQRCEICKEYFVGLLSHQIKVHGFKKPNKSYNCNICKITFTRTKAYNSHRLSAMHKIALRGLKLAHSGVERKKKSDDEHEDCLPVKKEVGTRFKCPALNCKFGYPNIPELNKHKEKCFYYAANSSGGACKYCGKTFKHGLRVHSKRCDQKYVTNRDDNSSLLGCPDEVSNAASVYAFPKPVPSEHCEKRDDFEDPFVSVDDNVMGEGKEKKQPKKMSVKCLWCDLEFKLKAQLLEHANIHEQSNNIVCEYCGKVSNSLDKQWKHERLCGNEILCNACGKLFRGKKNLNKHMYCVHPEKPSVCELCGKMCKNKHSLSNHLQKHEDEKLDKKSFKCKECGKILKHSLSLKSHMQRAHYGIEAKRILHCPICGKTTKNASNMRIHQRVHDPNRGTQKVQTGDIDNAV